MSPVEAVIGAIVLSGWGGSSSGCGATPSLAAKLDGEFANGSVAYAGSGTCASNLRRGGQHAAFIDVFKFELRVLFCHFGRAVSWRPCSKCWVHEYVVPLPHAQFHLFAESPRGAGGDRIYHYADAKKK